MRFGGELLVGVSGNVGGCVLDGALDNVVRRWRVEHVPRERRVGVGNAESDRIHRAEIFDCLLMSRVVSVVTGSRVGFGMTGRLWEFNQTSPHQTMEICNPERNRSAGRQTTTRRREKTDIVQQ